MKVILTLITIVLFLPSSLSADGSGVYFCSSTDSNGFGIKNGIYESGRVEVSRFKAKIDFNKKTFISSDLEMNDNSCKRIFDEGMTCSQYGYSININKNNLKFVLAKGYGYAFSSNDTVSISIGTCELF